MKKAIKTKIQQLLAAIQNSENINDNENRAFRMENAEGLARQIGKFCRQMPVKFLRFIRPGQQLDLQ